MSSKRIKTHFECEEIDAGEDDECSVCRKSLYKKAFWCDFYEEIYCDNCKPTLKNEKQNIQRVVDAFQESEIKKRSKTFWI